MSKPREEAKVEKKKTIISAVGLSCAGTVCIDDDGNVRVDMSKSSCPAQLIKAIEESVKAGKEIVFDVGRQKLKK